MTLSERLRDYPEGSIDTSGSLWERCLEAADALDAQEKRIKELEGAARNLVRECERIPFQNNMEFSFAVDRAREVLK